MVASRGRPLRDDPRTEPPRPRSSWVRSRTSPPSSTPPVGAPVTWNVPWPKGYPVPPREGPVVPYLRVQPRQKDGARLESTAVAAQRRDEPRWTPTWRPKPMLCHPPPEAGGRPDGCRIETTLNVADPPADPEKPCSPSIFAGRLPASELHRASKSGRRLYATRHPLSERWVPPNLGSGRCIR